MDRKGKAMNLKGVAALLLFFFATAFNALAVDFLCFASDGDCKENGPFLNVEWITVVRNLGSGQIEVWFDGWPGRGGSTQWSQVDWDHFFRHVIQKHDFKQFADYYIKDYYLRRVACTSTMCELQIHPHAIRLVGDAVDAIKRYLSQQVEAGRIITNPSQ